MLDIPTETHHARSAVHPLCIVDKPKGGWRHLWYPRWLHHALFHTINTIKRSILMCADKFHENCSWTAPIQDRAQRRCGLPDFRAYARHSRVNVCIIIAILLCQTKLQSVSVQISKWLMCELRIHAPLLPLWW